MQVSAQDYMKPILYAYNVFCTPPKSEQLCFVTRSYDLDTHPFETHIWSNLINIHIMPEHMVSLPAQSIHASSDWSRGSVLQK